MLETARIICKSAHAGQVDRGGADYYLHPFAVAEMCKTEEEKIVALLHDVVEDTAVTLEDLTGFGFSPEIIEAIDALTHAPNEDYCDYIARVKKNKLAAVVKINDLIHNSDLSRLKAITPKDLARKEKYKRCIEILRAEQSSELQI